MSYQLKSDQGELSTEEKSSLSASVKTACEGLPMHNIITKIVDLTQYQVVLCALNAGAEGCESPVTNEPIITVTIPTFTTVPIPTITIPVSGCTNVQVNFIR